MIEILSTKRWSLGEGKKRRSSNDGSTPPAKKTKESTSPKESGNTGSAETTPNDSPSSPRPTTIPVMIPVVEISAVVKRKKASPRPTKKMQAKEKIVESEPEIQDTEDEQDSLSATEEPVDVAVSEGSELLDPVPLCRSGWTPINISGTGGVTNQFRLYDIIGTQKFPQTFRSVNPYCIGNNPYGIPKYAALPDPEDWEPPLPTDPDYDHYVKEHLMGQRPLSDSCPDECTFPPS